MADEPLAEVEALGVLRLQLSEVENRLSDLLSRAGASGGVWSERRS
jgi:hypothetical protein